MISIDTVYQKVLALANKEQRGYITPQEFNLLAKQAQMEIFEQYFYDEKQEDKSLKNSLEFSNVDIMLDEKISAFKKSASVSIPLMSQNGTLPSDLYRLGTVFDNTKGHNVEQVTEQRRRELDQSPLTKPSSVYPVFVRTGSSQITFYPTPVGATFSCNYIKIPKDPNWTYVVVNEKALYNATNVSDFELHRSDEAELVYKILSLAGIVIAKPGLGTYSDQQITKQQQQEKV